jgi:hypothetical protein
VLSLLTISNESIPNHDLQKNVDSLSFRNKKNMKDGQGYSPRRPLCIPFTNMQTPRRHDPQGHAEDHEHSARVGGHQRLAHKAGVEVDLGRPGSALGPMLYNYT